ncbi:hypothetical protein C8A01DRAFT_35752 [Parachaetomium inaequale]|uniref:DUF6987 domain-containing protein n=1 Tax=Parachaetomium inaequale TaxID=2588326 RepID=A0AAN6SSC5_9PEZI|nr:hypothetical protein C8A01DRAFT_35752 [Parachaetomium inaequale]
MSSNVDQMTAPPGSWPCNKGEPGDTAQNQSAATPRSPPAVPEYQGFGGGGSSADESRSGDYTHRDPQTKSQEKGGDQKEEGEQEPIKMTDVEPKPVDEKEEEKQEGKGEQEDEKETVKGDTAPPDVEQQQSEQQESKTEQAGDDIEAPAETGTNASLTEKAKQAFDQASENQPTNDARDSFLEAAQNNLVAPNTASPQPQEEEQKAPEVEASEKAGDTSTEIQDKPQTEKGEDVPVTEEKAAPETQEKHTETEDKAAPETQEQPAEAEEKASPEPQAEEQATAQDEPKPTSEEAEAAAAEKDESKPDFTVLTNGTVNKGGNVVSPDGQIVGRVAEGEVKHLVGKTVDENGAIWSSSGKVVGKAEPIPDSERDAMLREPAPFESFPDAVVDKDGMVTSSPSGGELVGRVVQGDKSVLRGKSVDADGDILDKGGNVIGKAERWEPEPEKEPEPEPEVDKSVLAGKRVNKAGNVVDGNGTIFGRVVEGDVKRMVGRMCDKKGNILSESGDVLGNADLVPEGEREGLKEGPFAELQGCTVAKDGTIVTPAGDIVGRLTSGDGKVLFGRAVDEDGDILDKNGNTVGKAERWEPEKVEHKKNPMSGRRVNREGNVVDEDGNLIGKLTSGDLSICSGKDIDDDGDVVDYKGNTVGHCSLLEDIPKEEPKEEESPEEKEKREQAEKDKKLAVQMSVCIEQCLDSIRPICKMITEKIDKAERTPEDERDEEALVKEVRPLIEEGGRILNEAKGIIKGLDPEGRISANAKHKTAAREATPEEYHLADVLKDLTGDVTQCIDNAKRKLEDMPHAKKELNPLWGLLNEPLFQILAAVGLLLAGVLNLVGRLLGGLGLGGLVDGLLGTLGLNRVLEGLGLGSFSKSLKSGKKGGLLGGVLGG